MSTTVHRKAVRGTSQKSTQRVGPASPPGEIPVLIRLPDLSSLDGSARVAHGSHTTRSPQKEAETSRTAADTPAPVEDRRLRREFQPKPMPWRSASGKLALAGLLISIAIACYVLLSGSSRDGEEVLGPDIVWPDPSKTADEPSWQEPATADRSLSVPKPTIRRADADADTPRTSAAAISSAAPKTSDSRDEYKPDGPVTNPPLPDLNAAGFNSDVYSDRYQDPTMTRNPDQVGQGTDSSPNPRPWTPGNAAGPAEVMQPRPQVSPGDSHHYPDTGMPPYDLRYATRPSQRSAQLPPEQQPVAPQGALQGTIQNPPIRPQHERTGSGLY